MTMRPSFLFHPRRHWQRKLVLDDMDFIDRVMRFWDVGLDTFDIAQSMFEPEHVIAKAVHRGRERRRSAHEAS